MTERILIVDDHPLTRDALAGLLRQNGFDVVGEAAGGAEAIELAGTLKPDLVLLDLSMPEMDGLTAMREIRKRPNWKKLPIIAITAKAMRDDQEKAIEAGANDYIAKPIDIEKLLSLSRVWISKS